MNSFNISYFLDENHWSSCWIYVNEKLYEITITHIYAENPIEEFLNALIGIMNGERERKLNLYGEPGGDQIILREKLTQKDLLDFRIIGFSEEYGQEIKNLEATTAKIELEFEIKKVQLIRIFYYEFKKISELMKDKAYQAKRIDDFPFRKFREFENIALDYIK